ncbi:MAG: apolipoprotein N-acyltransferase [Planctomycetia bacterium]|nr:apolipoprotein N-acyltransferase [Planctomycetia bacterium]
MSVITSPAQPIDQARDAPLLASVRLVVLPVATGVMLALAFPPGNLQFLAWVALVPLGLALRDKRNWPELYFGLYLGGLAFHLIHLDWIRSGGGASWLSGPRATQWLAQGVMLALIWPMTMCVGRFFISRARLPMALALPIVWIAFEFARRHLWAICDATGYPYGQLGLTQSDHIRFIQIADLGGVYAVTAIVAAVNGLVVDVICWLIALRRHLTARAPIAATVGVTVIVGAVWLYGSWRISQDTSRTGPVVGLMPRRDWSASDVEVDSDAEDDVDCNLCSVAAMRRLRERNGQRDHADLLIWSEGIYPGQIALTSPAQQSNNRPLTASQDSTGDELSGTRVDEIKDGQLTVARMERFARRAGASLVVGCKRLEVDGSSNCYNSAAVVDPRRGYLGAFDKLRLVPFSEFYPPGRPLFGPARPNSFAHGEGYPVFSVEAREPARVSLFAVTICYDTGFPELYRRYMRPPTGETAPAFFVVPACEAHDRAMRLQHLLLALAKFRAIECRRALVRNAQAGYSGIIDGNGTLIAQPPEIDFKEPAILGRMPLDQRTSLYPILGDWLPSTACVVILLVALRRATSYGAHFVRRIGTRPVAA